MDWYNYPVALIINGLKQCATLKVMSSGDGKLNSRWKDYTIISKVSALPVLRPISSFYLIHLSSSAGMYVMLFMLFSCSLFTQTNAFQFEQFDKKDGLSNQDVLSLYQDHCGFLWVGTFDGLNRFDGKTFTPIYLSDSTKENFFINEIRVIAEDTDNLLLLQTQRSGIVVFDPQTYKYYDPLVPYIQELGNYVNNFIVDRHKNIWVIGPDALIEFDPHFKFIRKWKTTEDFYWLPKNITWWRAGLCLADEFGYIWFSVNGSFNVIDPENGKVYNADHNPFHWKILEVTNAGLSEDNLGNLWPLGPEGIYKFNRVKNELTYFPALSERILTQGSLLLQDGRILLLSGLSEFYLFNPLTETFQTVSVHVSQALPRALPGSVNAIQDKTGNVWIASYGLIRYKLKKNQFLYDEDFGPYNFSSRDNKNGIMDIILARSNLLIPTVNGFFIMNTVTHLKKQYRYTYGNEQKKNSFWTAIALDHQNLLVSSTNIVGGARVGLFTIDLKREILKKFALPHPGMLDSITVVGFFHDQEHQIWMSMIEHHGIFRWNRKTNQFIHYGANETGSRFFPLRHFNTAAEDSQGHIWMGYDKGGATSYDYKLHQFISLPEPYNEQLKNAHISVMLNDGNGNIWVVTDADIIQCSLDSCFTRRYNRGHGLASNRVKDIACDNNRKIWIGTDVGLSCFNPETRRFTNFTTEDGLPEGSLNSLVFDTLNNTMCVASNNGVIFFNPDSLQKSFTPIHPSVTSFKVLGNAVTWNDSSTVNLSPENNSFSFEYSTPNMLNAEDNQYAYRLDGFDPDWVLAGKRQFVNYTSLQGGDYSFRVKATTDGLKWSEMDKQIKIHVATRFYKSIWFRLSIIFLVILLITTIFYILYRFKLQRYILSQKLRNKIAGDLHDDIGSTLSSIAIFSELAKEETKEKSQHVTELLESINDNARSTLDSMSDIVWAINPINDHFENILTRMRTFASGILEVKNIDLMFDAAAVLSSLKLSMEKRKNLYLIFKESVNNVAKYSKANNCVIKLWIEGKMLNMKIEDNGTGFDLNDYPAGNGLSNMKNRSIEMMGKLDIQSVKEIGTSVHLSFPTT